MATYKKPFEIDEDDLARLAPDDFVKLMKQLIVADLHDAGIPASAVAGTLRVNIPDGGEDIRVEWSGGPERTAFIPKRCTIYQCKAEKLSEAKIKAEPVLNDKSGLKVAVADVIAQHGAYIMATTKQNTVSPKTGAAPNSKKIKKTKKKVKRQTKLKDLIALIRGSITNFSPEAKALEIDFLGPHRLVDWVNSHTMVARWTKQCLGKAASNFPFQPLQEWARYEEVQTPMQVWEDLNDHMAAISKTLAQPGQVVRLQGHSGLGKSRLVFEALRRSSGDPSTDLEPLVAYVRHIQQGLLGNVQDLSQNGERVVLVVDDCSPDLHRQLADEVKKKGSALSLITIDLSFDTTPDQQIILKEVPDEIIKGILQEAGFTGSNEDLNRATAFCNGFPQIAVLVGQAIAGGATHFGQFKNQDFIVAKLIWGRDAPNDEQLRLLRALSIFALIGFEGSRRAEFDWIAANLLEMTSDELQQRLEPFERRRILQKRGFSLFVVPKPLAAHLAAYFWTSGPVGKRDLLLAGGIPGELQQQLCERLRDLDYLNNAPDIARQLCGESGPFGTAEALNTEFGARCLRALAEVAPEEVTAALVRSFGDWSIDKVRTDLTAGRRQIVWTIEALAWVPAVFEDAMRILLKLAAGENETWSNNATGEFKQRFRIQLPGTSAPLEQRLNTLRAFISSSNDSTELSILVASLIDAIDANGHSRVIGSENHGTKKSYQDHHPTYAEIYQYAKGALELLIDLAHSHPALVPQIRAELSGINPAIVFADAPFPYYVKLINSVRPVDRPWSELLDKLSWSLRHQLSGEEKSMAEVRTRVAGLFDELIPHTLEDRILFYVKSVPWNFEEPGDPDDDDDDFTQNRKRAISIASEVALHWDVFIRAMPALSTGEVREGFAFGEAFFNASNRGLEAIGAAMSTLGFLQKNQNPSLLGGLLAGLYNVDPKGGMDVLRAVAADNTLRKHLAYLASIKLTEESLSLVTAALLKKEIPSSDAYIFGMGGVLAPLPLDAVVDLFRALRSIDEVGELTAIHLMVMYCHGSGGERFELIKEEIFSALQSSAPFADSKKRRKGVEHDYERLARKLLKDPKLGKPLAKFILKAIIDSVRRGKLSNDMFYQRLLSHLFEFHPDISLQLFAKAIDQGERTNRWYLSTVLGSQFSFQGKGEGPLFRLSEDKVIAACLAYPQTLAPLVAEIAPLFMEGENGKEWSSLGRRLLDEFGKRKEILEIISRNIFTGGYMGPTSLHYSTFLPPLEMMLGHRFIQVRTWARSELTTLKRQIAREIKNEEEQSIRND